jgi:hypothetical protein
MKKETEKNEAMDVGEVMEKMKEAMKEEKTRKIRRKTIEKDDERKKVKCKLLNQIRLMRLAGQIQRSRSLCVVIINCVVYREDPQRLDSPP